MNKRWPKVALLLLFSWINGSGLFAQRGLGWVRNDVFQSRYWMENLGQFDAEFPAIKHIKFVYEAGFSTYLITNEGIAYQQIIPRGVKFPHRKKGDQTNNNGPLWDTVVLFQQFVGSDPCESWVRKGGTPHDFTFGEPRYRLKGYRTIEWTNVYPNVDVLFTIDSLSQKVKYSFRLRAGANPDLIRSNFSLPLTQMGDTMVQISRADWSFTESGLKLLGDAASCFWVRYQLRGDALGVTLVPKKSLNLEQYLSRFGSLEIDPFVTIKAHDPGASAHTNELVMGADHDAFGNVYFYGEAIGYRHKVCKYAPDGTLIWTMIGTPPGVYLRFNPGPYGAIRVDRCTGKVYCLPGSGPPSFFRINENGENDHYWAKPVEPEPSKEFWEIQFVPTMHSMGFFAGAHLNNTDLYNVTDSFPVALQSCLTEDSTQGSGAIKQFVNNGRDYVNAVVDDHGKIFAVMAQGFGPKAYASKKYSNRVIAINDSFTSRYWEAKWGFNGFWELQNSVAKSLRFGFDWLADWLSHNRCNGMAVYDQYLYVYDGKHFVAMDKSTGKILAADSLSHLTVNFQSGIAVDSCNHIYLGGDSSRVYVYQFDGVQFQRKKVLQVLQGDYKKVYDVTYNFDEHLLYVSGDSFAAAVDCGVPCGNKILLETSYWRSCGEPLWARVKNPDSTLTYTFVWRKVKNNEQVRSRGVPNEFVDSLKDVSINTDYKLYVFVSSFCTGTFKTAYFQVKQSFDSAIALSICEGDTFYYHDKKLFSAGNYTDSLKTFFGCDSLVRYSVSQRTRSFRDTMANICRGDSFMLWQQKFNQSGIYRDTFVNAVGCDSIVRLLLTVMYDSISQQRSICEGDSVRVGSHLYRLSGTYLDTLKTVRGCDSMVLTWLTVHPKPSVLVDMDLCNVDSLQYRGRWYNPPFVIHDTLRSANGCDSVVVVRVRSRTVDARFDIDSSGIPVYRFVDKSIGAVRWYWDFGDGSNSLSQFVTHQFQSSMRWDPLRVCLIVTDSVGCEDTVCRQFLLHPDIEVTIPEGFSPNDDGDNDVLTISNAWAFPRADWSVFNRWGQVVYLSNDTQRNHWDGRCNTPGCNGDRLPEGVYYLVFQYNDGKRKNLSRNVYLKR